MADVTISLSKSGTTVLLPGLVIESDIAPTGVRAETTKTLSGRMVIWETAEHGGRNIDLTGGADFGWLTRGDLAILQGWAATESNSITLTLNDATTKTVRFRNEDLPAIEGVPIVARQNQASGDYYNNIKIKLMEV